MFCGNCTHQGARNHDSCYDSRGDPGPNRSCADWVNSGDQSEEQHRKKDTLPIMIVPVFLYREKILTQTAQQC